VYCLYVVFKLFPRYSAFKPDKNVNKDLYLCIHRQTNTGLTARPGLLKCLVKIDSICRTSFTFTAGKNNHHTTTTVLRPFFRDHPGEPVPEENFWTSWCKGRLTAADTLTTRLGATPSGLTSAHLHHPLTGRMPFLPPNQQCQSTEGNCW